MSNLYWLDDDGWKAIEPLIPMNCPGVKPGRNRQVISGILHMLKVGCRRGDCPGEYEPATTVYNRFNRWSKVGILQTMAAHLVKHDATDILSIDSTTSKAHRCSAGGKGGPRRRPSAAVAAGERRRSTPSSTLMGA